MRQFSSYGPVNTTLHYYVSREHLIERACTQLIGQNPMEGGHYFTVWAPRQCGKTWIMIQTLWKLMKDDRFHVLKLDLEHLKNTEDTDEIVRDIGQDIISKFKLKNISVTGLKDFKDIFKQDVLDKPLILILDEFDALIENAISSIAGVFRNIYNLRQKDPNPSAEKEYLLHSVALMGVRSVLGIENRRGSPFNVQRSLKIPVLTFEETQSMFKMYEKESGQKIEQEVIDRLFYETCGQPGLVSWFGELLTETYNEQKDIPLNAKHFNSVYLRASAILPNVNVINIVSKARQKPYCDVVMQLFRTDKKTEFRFDDSIFNFLYMNGVIDVEEQDDKYFVKFPSPFIQKRLFNFFSRELFNETGKLFEPFEDLSDAITPDSLNIRNLMKRYQTYLKLNRDWLLCDVPRRKDMRIFEAVFHFNLYTWLSDFFQIKKGRIFPEFPTGNGKIDLLINYADKNYGIELKTFTDESGYFEAIKQAAKYGKQLKLSEISLVFFVEYIDDANREKYEKDHIDQDTGVKVLPAFVATG